MAKPVKWAIGSEEPEDLPGFKSNDEIGKPPRGVYTFEITKIAKTVTQKGDDRLVVTAVIAEKDKDKKKWNGYTIWEGFMFLDQSLPFLKRFLKSIGVTWKEFADKSMIDDTVDPPEVTKIGKLNLRGKTPVLVKAATKDDPYAGQDRLSITSFLAPPEDADDEDADEEIDEEVDEEIEEVEETESEEEEEEPWTREDLEDPEMFDLKELKAEAAKLGIEESEYKSVRKRSTIVDLILTAQEGDEDEEEEDEEDEEEEIDLDELTPAELKVKAKELGAGPRDLKKAKTKALLVALVTELMDEEDGDEEDGDEPPF